MIIALSADNNPGIFWRWVYVRFDFFYHFDYTGTFFRLFGALNLKLNAKLEL
jgi:hypothetical protein